MLGLPKSTELNKQLPKKAIYTKFSMSTVERDKYDTDISRIVIVNEISSQTVKTLSATDDVQAIYVLSVQLKKKDYDEKTIEKLFRLINQKMLLVLEYGDECRLAVYYTKLLQSDWKKKSECIFILRGLDLDAVWQHIVQQVGNIQIEEGHSLEEQIVSDEQRAKIQAEIEKLEKLAWKETQPKKKFDLVKKIMDLKEPIND